MPEYSRRPKTLKNHGILLKKKHGIKITVYWRRPKITVYFKKRLKNGYNWIVRCGPATSPQNVEKITVYFKKRLILRCNWIVRCGPTYTTQGKNHKIWTRVFRDLQKFATVFRHFSAYENFEKVNVKNSIPKFSERVRRGNSHLERCQQFFSKNPNIFP